MLIDLTPSELMALRSALGEHLLCPARTEVFVDVVGGVETTLEQLLVKFVHGTASPATECPTCRGCGRVAAAGGQPVYVNGRPVPWTYVAAMQGAPAARPQLCADCGGTGHAIDVRLPAEAAP